jgi:GT2 family glycosyltransferase
VDELAEEVSVIGQLNVVAATVTYGHGREGLCTETVRRALAAGADRVVVILNGNTEGSAALLDEGLRDVDVVDFVHLPANAGSAAGFAEALTHATALSPRYVWLLDDDNWPEPNCLELLLDQLSTDSLLGAAAAMRSRRPEFRPLLDGVPVSSLFPVPGSFMNFHLGQRVRRAMARRVPTEVCVPDVWSIPTAPYGGLLLPASIISQIGLPDRDFVLYEDDSEYTARLVALGRPVRLVRKAVIIDADLSWSVGKQGSGPRRMLENGSDATVFYATRNRVFLDYRAASYMSARGWLRVNRLVFEVALLVERIRHGHGLRYRLIRRAMSDGARGHLGAMEEFRLAA